MAEGAIFIDSADLTLEETLEKMFNNVELKCYTELLE